MITKYCYLVKKWTLCSKIYAFTLLHIWKKFWPKKVLLLRNFLFTAIPSVFRLKIKIKVFFGWLTKKKPSKRSRSFPFLGPFWGLTCRYRCGKKSIISMLEKNIFWSSIMPLLSPPKLMAFWLVIKNWVIKKLFGVKNGAKILEFWVFSITPRNELKIFLQTKNHK